MRERYSNGIEKVLHKNCQFTSFSPFLECQLTRVEALTLPALQKPDEQFLIITVNIFKPERWV